MAGVLDSFTLNIIAIFTWMNSDEEKQFMLQYKTG